MAPCVPWAGVWSPPQPPETSDQLHPLPENTPHLHESRLASQLCRLRGLGPWARCSLSLYLSPLVCVTDSAVLATWGWGGLNVIAMQVPGTVPAQTETMQMGFSSPRPALRKISLEPSVGERATGPRLQAPPALRPTLWVSHSESCQQGHYLPEGHSPTRQGTSCRETLGKTELPADPASGPAGRGRSQGQSCLHLWFLLHLDCVVAEKSRHTPSAVVEGKGLVRTLEGGGPLRVEDCVSNCRHRERVSVSQPKPGGGVRC